MACALAIGGLDPGGGAGILADVRAFHAAGVFGCAAAAVITIQSTAGLVSARPLASREVLAQVGEVVRAQRVHAIKVGALGSISNVVHIGAWLASHREIAVVVDPVMIPSRGEARLLASDALVRLRTELVPYATLLTANVAEAEVLTGAPVASLEDAREAARALCRMGARAALVKGGHLARDRGCDVLALGDREVELAAPTLTLPPTHGTGCTLAALVAGRLASTGAHPARPADGPLVDAVRWAKACHFAALEDLRDIGGALRVLVPGHSARPP